VEEVDPIWCAIEENADNREENEQILQLITAGAVRRNLLFILLR